MAAGPLIGTQTGRHLRCRIPRAWWWCVAVEWEEGRGEGDRGKAAVVGGCRWQSEAGGGPGRKSDLGGERESERGGVNRKKDEETFARGGFTTNTSKI